MIELDALPGLPNEAAILKQVASSIPYDILGTVVAVGSQIVTVEGMRVPLGSICRIDSTNTSSTLAEVVAIEGNQTRLAPLDRSNGVSTGERVRFVTVTPTIPVGPQLLGRAVDCEGKPIDGGPPIASACSQPIRSESTECLNRERCLQALRTGVRTIDAFHTLAQGQRIGIFAGAGVGKSSLLGMLARGTAADVIVAGLVGERGREVNDFLHNELTPELRSRSVTVVETSEASATRRVQAALSATAIAEYFRDQGLNVLLLMDSVTRFAQAQREIGLAAGEPPTTRGYPPSVFSALPQLLERAGICENSKGKRGSITGIYSVLVEGDDPNEPISDALRGILDGHVLMSRKPRRTWALSRPLKLRRASVVCMPKFAPMSTGGQLLSFEACWRTTCSTRISSTLEPTKKATTRGSTAPLPRSQPSTPSCNNAGTNPRIGTPC